MNTVLPEGTRAVLLQSLTAATSLLQTCMEALKALTDTADDGDAGVLVPDLSGDPRDPSVQGFRQSEGYVYSILLNVHSTGQRFRCVRAAWQNTSRSTNQIVATVKVLDRAGNPLRDPVILATGYRGNPNEFDNLLLPGGNGYPIQHVISNGFDAAKGVIGPLAVYVSAPGNITRIQSDIVGGLGLPNNQHGVFDIIFQET